MMMIPCSTTLLQQCSFDNASLTVLLQRCSFNNALSTVLPKRCSFNDASLTALLQRCSFNIGPLMALPRQRFHATSGDGVANNSTSDGNCSSNPLSGSWLQWVSRQKVGSCRRALDDSAPFKASTSRSMTRCIVNVPVIWTDIHSGLCQLAWK